MFLILLPNTFSLSWNILIFVLGVAWNYKMVTVKWKLNVVHSPALMRVLLGCAFMLDGAHLHRYERWIGCLEEEPIPGAVDFTLAFSVTEKTWANLQQLNYFRIFSGFFGCANWLHVHKSYNLRHVFLKLEC